MIKIFWEKKIRFHLQDVIDETYFRMSGGGPDTTGGAVQHYCQETGAGVVLVDIVVRTDTYKRIAVPFP